MFTNGATVGGMIAANCSYLFVKGLSESSGSSLMIACDKNGSAAAAAVVATGDSTKWGLNHNGDGGEVLAIDGSVTWYNNGSVGLTNSLSGGTNMVFTGGGNADDH